ncbi:thioredoxin family protein [Bremerella sp. JC770]|uniref:thioredoxin family protein n=1 Tax=Bremerella sp. JC770 TaxID=3232137 RepID=UPI003458E213
MLLLLVLLPTLGDIGSTPVTCAGEVAQEDPHAAVTIAWRTNLEEAQEEARESGKVLVLFFTGSDWCVYCHLLEEHVLTKPDMMELIERTTIPVKLDYPNESRLPDELAAQNAQVRQRLGIQGFPSVCLVDDQLRAITAIRGFSGVDDWKDQWAKAVETVGQFRAVLKGRTFDSLPLGERDAALKLIPPTSLDPTWMDVITEMSESNADPLAAAHWRMTLRDIEEAKYVSRLRSRLFRAAYARQLPWKETMQQVEAELAGVSPWQSERLEVLRQVQTQLLMTASRFAEASEVIQQTLLASKVSEEYQRTANAQQMQIALMQGREQEFRVQLQDTYRLEHHGQSPGDAEIRHQTITLWSGSGYDTKGLAAFEKMRADVGDLAMLPRQSILYHYADSMAAGTARNHRLRGELKSLLASSRLARTGNYEDVDILFAEAAVCFQASGEGARAAQELKRMAKMKASDDQPPWSEKVSLAIESASASPAAALSYLASKSAQTKRHLATSGYWMQAAIALRDEGDVTRAEVAAGKSDAALAEARLHPTPDRETLDFVLALHRQWKATSTTNNE